MYRVKVTK